ncbi:endolytic transglycosylase MltG [Alkalicoccus daliensis]|uniref:Endolytic murein transglycosylase n=1 Tax=Alkalicoccus daliensis TaxID=745820 RepID=A0A1H0BIM0_9BACI|nr:endolytic transglycosylase MltG [Alkalicoccus daliensis]SDN45467.1 UPF0755 protein [Alkalicoccus daliensis]
MSEISKEEKKRLKKEAHLRKVQERKKEAGLVRKIVFSIIVLFILILGAVGFGSYQYVMGALGPLDEESSEAIEVEIPIGSTTDSIAEILEEEEVIASATMFRYYVRLQSEDGFQAGQYELSQDMTLDEIIVELQEGTVYEDYAASFTIPEGLWAEEIFPRIEEATEVPADDFEALLEDDEYLQELIEEYDILSDNILEEDIRVPLEGYLFPARYDLMEEELEAASIIETMLSRMQTEIEQATGDPASDNMHELLTRASIIEGEARNDEERHTISGVIENRISIPMALQMDPTVAYAHGERLARTMFGDTEIESPYNTYHVQGLPIGPINNPGAASIQAAAEPEQHDYLYFYHSPDGEVHFNETYEEHQATVSEYQ